jgi:hypothetical protein
MLILHSPGWSFYSPLLAEAREVLRQFFLCIGNFTTSTRTPFTSHQIPLVSFRIHPMKMP